MKTKKYRFSIATRYINSEDYEIVELQFDDNATEDEINNEVSEIYQTWANERNQGYWKEVE